MRFRQLVPAFLIPLALAACKRSASAPPESAEALDNEAQSVAMTEIQKHYTKSPDGWTSVLLTGTADSPARILRQYKEIDIIGVNSTALSPSDKLNGFQWAGELTFKAVPARESGDPGIAFDNTVSPLTIRLKNHWTQWLTATPVALHVQKVNGQWQFPDDASLLRGKIPTPEDFKTLASQ